MVLIDPAGHLTATGGARELHAFAELMGLSPIWYQAEGRFQHYECATQMARKRAQSYGAIHVPFHVLFAVARRAGLYEPELTSHGDMLEGRLREHLRRPDARLLRCALGGTKR